MLRSKKSKHDRCICSRLAIRGHAPGLTLIGDAAHLTPPSGEGVNCGMLDALELSDAIISSLENEGEAFEKKMWERSKEMTEEALKMKKMMFEDEKAPEEGVCEDF
jgi:2-polyprenyl-6-methoxyphenol hydroxylase-like FAD-dependent oxidoreductase